MTKNLRIISGNNRGLCLNSPKNLEIVPTKNMVKESLFNIIQDKIEGSSFLDLFGGSGQIGIEAASRGAKSVVIVDSNRDAIQTINKNVLKLKNANINVIFSDSQEFLIKTTKSFDIAFLDPPYKSNLLENIYSKINKIMNENSVIISETPYEKEIVDKINDFMLQKRYKYGKTYLNLYNKLSV